jgi:hypothetical protein
MKIYTKGISLNVAELNALQHILDSGIHNAQSMGCNPDRYNTLQSIKSRLDSARAK